MDALQSSLIGTEAGALLAGDDDLVRSLATRIIKPERNNFVERPWGGLRLRELKGFCALPDQKRVSGLGFGEVFEIAACSSDAEASQHPSTVRLSDGSKVSLLALLAAHSGEILGADFAKRHGAEFPLLPKTLDIAELLSVQGHPPGHTEAYVICHADEGATIRLGFRQDVEAEYLRRIVVEGRDLQARLIDLAGRERVRLQDWMAPWLADRRAGVESVDLQARLPGVGAGEIAGLLSRLKAIYWSVLDDMNEIPVEPGQVIHNVNPARIARASGREPAAEVHALGNPDGREIVAIEIRRPGPTLRVWDNVRFPLREIDVESALSVLNLKMTRPEEFLAERRPLAACENVFVSVNSEYFRIEHLCPSRGSDVAVRAGPPHYLHGLTGRSVLFTEGGDEIGSIDRGESALVPVRVGSYRVVTEGSAAEILRVSIP
jgi:mannose-6-phosphate isomerase class I